MANPEHLAAVARASTSQGMKARSEWRAQINSSIIDLSDSDLQAFNLKGFDLRKSNLQKAKLTDANLMDSFLMSADLTKAQLFGTELNYTELDDAILDDANLTGNSMEGTSLRRASLRNTHIYKVNLNSADLNRAKFLGAHIWDAQLRSVDAREAEFSSASFVRVAFDLTNFEEAVFKRTYFSDASFRKCSLWKADFTNVKMRDMSFIDIDLSEVIGLESVRHEGPSNIGIDTLYKSRGNIPEAFLRGCGVPETMITFAKSLVGKPIQYYSAFISYSSADEHFARRLHNDLQMNGVRVWFAPEDLKIGETIEDSIDQAIRVYDKLIIVLSQNSIERAWVKKEFSKAVLKEQQHGKTVLFPIRLDDSVFETSEQWAYDIRKRHIGDFNNWTNPLLYQNAINRLLKDLNAG